MSFNQFKCSSMEILHNRDLPFQIGETVDGSYTVELLLSSV